MSFAQGRRCPLLEDADVLPSDTRRLPLQKDMGTITENIINT